MTHCWNYILKVLEQISMFTHINKFIKMCFQNEHMDPSPTKHSACSGFQQCRDSQDGANAEYSDVVGDKNLQFGVCSNSIPTELRKYHKHPWAHTTVTFL